MSNIERAWIGAAIDMDGCIASHHGRKKFIRQWRALFSGMEVEHISALLRATGTGRVQYLGIDKHSTFKGKHPLWRWTTSKQADFESLVSQCAPYSLKCQKVLRAMKEVE